MCGYYQILYTKAIIGPFVTNIWYEVAPLGTFALVFNGISLLY